MSSKSQKTMKERQLEEGRRERQKYFDEMGISSRETSSDISELSYKSTGSKNSMKERQLEEGRRERQKNILMVTASCRMKRWHQVNI